MRYVYCVCIDSKYCMPEVPYFVCAEGRKCMQKYIANWGRNHSDMHDAVITFMIIGPRSVNI